MMKELQHLKYRRQFLFSAQKCSDLEDWKHVGIGNHHLYVHQDCGLDRVKKNKLEIVLIGYILSPNFPEKSTSQILENIADCITIENITKYLYSASGRYVLIIKKDDDYIFLNDACGLRTFFYTKYNENIYAASQPLLLKLVLNIKEGKRYYEYYESEYVKSTPEHWLPSGTSLYENVYHLVANHYLNSKTYEQVRYWPNKMIKKMSLDEGIEKLSYLLNNSMLAINNKLKLAITLTAGWDSRIVFSACKEISNDIIVYTLKYRKLTEKSKDIWVPKKLLSKLGLKHQIIDCKKPIDESFVKIYQENSDMSHLNDWGLIANGMYYGGYPSERIAVKGSCSEIGRLVYPDLAELKPDVLTDQSLMDIEFNKCNNIPFIKEQLFEWFNCINDEKVNYGYDILDLFYWEQKMNSWQGQSQLEWDIVQDTFTPFNNREIIDIMLAVKPEYRVKPNYVLFTKVMEKLWKEVLEVPINPKSTSFKIRFYLRKNLLNMGKFRDIKKVFRK